MNDPAWLEVKAGEAPLLVSIPHTGIDLGPYEKRFVSAWLARKDADWRIEQACMISAGSLGATTGHLHENVAQRDRRELRPVWDLTLSGDGDDRALPDDDVRRRAALSRRSADRGGGRRTARALFRALLHTALLAGRAAACARNIAASRSMIATRSARSFHASSRGSCRLSISEPIAAQAPILR